MAGKISQLTPNTRPLLTDALELLDDPAGTPDNQELVLDYLVGTGWLAPGDTWVYVSGTSFKVLGVDRTGRYRPGTKLRYKQGGAYKYAYVASSSFATDTTVTISGGSDFSLISAAITDNDLSYAEAPQGFPEWLNWGPTITGYSVNPTSAVYRFKMHGRSVRATIQEGADGTSNATTTTYSLPISPAATITNQVWSATVPAVRDNGADAAGGLLQVSSGGTVISAFKTGLGGVWTASGGKRAASRGAVVEYEV